MAERFGLKYPVANFHNDAKKINSTIFILSSFPLQTLKIRTMIIFFPLDFGRAHSAFKTTFQEA
jgi:hypothetical protein